MITRRRGLAVLSGLFAGLVPRRSFSTSHKRLETVVGAIRWDAWYDPNSVPGRAVIKTLSPSKYHDRLPFFAHILSSDEVYINGDNQDTMDAEIELAHEAGLSFWAFSAYRQTSSMSLALKLYLSSKKKAKINFCLLSGVDLWGDPRGLSDTLDWHIGLLREEQYQKVNGGRPLYFLGFISDTLIEQRWSGVLALRAAIQEFRERAVRSGVPRPYIVLLDEPERAARLMTSLGCDAISQYSVNFNRRSATYSQLAADAEQVWRRQIETGAQVVPIIMTGMDRRPRIENPVPWERQRMGRKDLSIYYGRPLPFELSAHVGACIDLLYKHPAATEPAVALIYAWNENDEGGWLIPTLGDGRLRIDTLKSILMA